jgi:ribosomal subunit interface protein
MDFEVSGVHYKISDATREHLEKKIERFERMKDIIRSIRVVITKESTGYTVEITVSFTWGGESVRIHDSDEHLWPLIDIVFDRADTKLGREKEKHERKA